MNTNGKAKKRALLAACLMVVGGLAAQDKASVYLSLKQGNVTVASGKLTAYKYNTSTSTWAQVTNETINYSNTYEIGMWASGQDPTSVIPTAVTTVNGGTVNIVNVSDSLLSAKTNWDTRASSVRNEYKSANAIDIAVPNGKTLNIVLNNCWTTATTGFQFRPGGATNSTQLLIGLKGDNRFTNFHVVSSLAVSDNGYNGAAQTKDLSVTQFSDVGSGTNKGTLVVNSGSNYASALGAADDHRSNHLVFKSGTYFAGSTTNSTAIGGGGNNPGVITIDGGTITAVNTSSGATIGGGMGGGNRGGDGYVTINGGEVYAYNHASVISNAYGVAPAIGGGSTNTSDGGYAEVTINGGTVIAQVKVGPAIAGGSTDCNGSTYANTYNSSNEYESTTITNPKAPGNAKVRITGGTVTATTLKKVILPYTLKDKDGNDGDTKYRKDNYPCSIGGGWNLSVRTVRKYDPSSSSTNKSTILVGSQVPAGNLDFEMTGGVLYTGSLVGGRNIVQTAYHGLSVHSISGGTIKGQFLQWNAASNSGSSSFVMTGGDIIGRHDCLYAENDGLVWCQRATGSITISGGSITGGHAHENDVGGNDFRQSGGAISIMRGTLNLNGGSITGCTATNRGGAVYCGTDNGAFTNLTINVGQTGSNPLIVRGNTVNGNPNDIYLNTGQTINVVGNGFNPQDVGIYTADGASNEIAVLTATTTSWLTNLYTDINNDTKNLFPDRTEYKVKPYTSGNTLYFYKNSGSPWSTLQQQTRKDTHLVDTDGDGYFDIGNVNQLTAFLWWVNGITTHDSNFSGTHANVKGKMTADIDMNGHYWVPIGTDFTGEFDGNGYIIKNLTMNRSNPSAERGMFGTTASGALIKNVQLVDCHFGDNPDNDTYMGCIVSQMNGGTLRDSNVGGVMLSTNNSCIMGGLVGNNAGGAIHSSAAMAEMTGYTMGGLVGNNGGSLKNSFANAKLTNSGSGYTGGLAASNSGTVENCYAREQSGSSHGNNFGWCVGNNNGTIAYCYIPVGETVYKANGTNQQNTCSTYGVTVTPYTYRLTDNQVGTNAANSHIVNGMIGSDGNGKCELKGLVATLNHWVAANSGYTPWMRTCASPINDDYPIFNHTDAKCVGSRDNISLEYTPNFNSKFNDFLTANVGTIFLYQSPSESITSTLTNSDKNTELYIKEDVVLLHTSTILAHTGIWLDNTAGANGANPSFGGSDDIDWHFFSSALADAPIGIVYGDNTQYAAYHYPTWQAYFSNANGYFPTNLNTGTPSGGDYYDDWDLYAYYEPDYHWINFKRNSQSHWHEDAPGTNIPYTNETTFMPGKGYMVALRDEGYLQAYGTLNTHTAASPLEVSIQYTSGISWTTREGHNLLGNPYQSYFDFDEFANTNSTLWSSSTTPFYVIIDEDQSDYVIYVKGASHNDSQASRYLYPHQGFMIIADKAGTARFHDGMRTTTIGSGWTAGFRGENRPNYPLVNLFVEDDIGNRDIVTVELGRPDKGGALKHDVLGTSKGRLSCQYEGKEYGLVFTQPGLDAAKIHFTTSEDCVYTMTWNTQNGEFGYMHLIDNMTGSDIDCLTTSEYRFSSLTTDYKSRFSLVFDYTGIEENGGGGLPSESVDEVPFAFYSNGEIHLAETPAETAQLQIIDMMGRVIVSRNASCPVFTNEMAAGVYVLRLTDGNGTKTQKIILD